MMLQIARLDCSDKKKRSDMEKETFKWLLASAEQRHAYAQMRVAMDYYQSFSMEHDREK
jgi:hypothetical protein